MHIPRSRWKRKLHGYGMMFTWGVAAPLAVIIARYTRNADGKFTPATMWWHMNIQLFVCGATAGGVTLGLIIGGFSGDIHMILGLIVGALSGYQFIHGMMCRPGPADPSRSTFNFLHHWAGRIALVTAWANFYWGVVPFNQFTGSGTATFVLAYAGPGIATLFFAVMEIKRMCCASDARVRRKTLLLFEDDFALPFCCAVR